MKGLPILLRLAQRSSEERCAVLSQSQQERLSAEAELAAYDRAVAAEDAAASVQIAAMGDWSAWMTAAARRRQDLTTGLALLEAREAEAREAVREALADTRRLELALEQITQTERRMALRREQQAAEEAELQRPKA